ncbi:zinc ABC transporter substrate-binding protein [uncultured Jannaschia sp.]|uniref:metal ABC transporter solute-binding protein, Zn/Mn family n=1 Tax=uncultured Jannaschia sp. TaxID=293347 RepID=UPI002636E085|nr:zinc ABC transporter substrate-binding protein [uncultured Jannaschia sp.]
MIRALAALAVLSGPAFAQDRPVIVADSYPVAFFAGALAGDAAEVRLAVPEGRDPSSWRPGLSEIVAIQAADLIVLNGSGLSDWTTRAALPRSRTVDTGRGVADDLIATDTITHSHGQEGSHSHEGVATHTWLDLDLAARQAEALAAAMGRALPDAPVAANLDALLADLDALDATGDALVEGAPVPVIASHPRYEYLGRAYGLDIAALDWTAGVAPDAAQLAALEAARAETGARIFIWEAEPPEAARAAVAALGLAQAVIPPLATPPAEGDFLSAFRDGLAELAAALNSLG